MGGRGDLGRRDFVRALLGAGAIAAGAGRVPLASAAEPAPSAPAMPARPLGRTGHQVRLFSLGGQATLEDPARRSDAAAIVNRAIDLGVNYLDTAPYYGAGASELAIGDVMQSRRAEVFLATKTHDRSYDGSMRLLEASLRRLRTDRLDLWQLHDVRRDGDLDFVLSREGAVRALERARDEKIVRFTGITGHYDPHVLRRAIERHPFDAALLALNAADRHGPSFVENALPAAVSRGLAVIGMKIPSRGRIFRADGIQNMAQAMGYVLTLPVSTVVVGISTVAELEENVAIARAFRPFTPEEMAALERLTRPYHRDVLWYSRGH